MATATTRAGRVARLNERRRITRNRANAATEDIVRNKEAFLLNTLLSRQNALANLFDPRRDIDNECGYPKEITAEQYRGMYDRELGNRVVAVLPAETWKQMPEIVEDPDPENETPFEAAWVDLDKQHQVFHFLHRIDELSGVGHYGLLMIGLNDGKPLDEPVAGINDNGTATPVKGREIIYLRALDESLVQIAGWEEDPTNPRFGMPTFYNLTLSDPRTQESGAVVTPPDMTEVRIHWSRVLHVADNRGTSEVLGAPRQRAVWNRLSDLRKVLGGSGEMYWRGGFPGISLESQPGIENPSLDVEATAEMMTDYMNGLQRYLALTGMTAKSLAPQISDPTPSFEVHVKAICIIIGVPYRIFMGTEQGVLAGTADAEAWDGRLQNRRERYVTPMVINPFIQRCIDYGVLPAPAEVAGWNVTWPDAHTPSDLDKAEVAVKVTEALAAYVEKGVDTLIPPFEFLTIVLGFDKDVVEAVLEAAIEHIEGIDDDEGNVPGRLPTPEPLEGEGGGDGDGSGFPTKKKETNDATKTS